MALLSSDISILSVTIRVIYSIQHESYLFCQNQQRGLVVSDGSSISKPVTQKYLCIITILELIRYWYKLRQMTWHLASPGPML